MVLWYIFLMSSRCHRFVTCTHAHISSVRLFKPALTEMAQAETIGSMGDMELRGAIPLCRNHYLHALCLSRPFHHSYSCLGSRLRLQPPVALWGRSEQREVDVASGSSEEQLDSERKDQEQVRSFQGPLPDLLPRNESPSWDRPQHRAPRGDGQLLEMQRVAHQLRLIGDGLNTALLHRGRIAPPGPLWRHGLQGFFHFICQTLSALYRLT